MVVENLHSGAPRLQGAGIHSLILPSGQARSAGHLLHKAELRCAVPEDCAVQGNDDPVKSRVPAIGEGDMGPTYSGTGTVAAHAGACRLADYDLCNRLRTAVTTPATTKATVPRTRKVRSHWPAFLQLRGKPSPGDVYFHLGTGTLDAPAICGEFARTGHLFCAH